MKASAKHVTSWLKARWFAFDVLFRDIARDAAKRSIIHAWLALLLFLGMFSVSLVAQSPPRTVHVFVALADNKNQGIVPVAARLGNGEDPANNLYWGSAYGVKSYFARSADWQLLVAGHGPKPEILERCIFKHRRKDIYLIADAYEGSKIKQAIVDFLEVASDGEPETISVKTNGKDVALAARGGADLVAYAGHDGLMDFQLPTLPPKNDSRHRDAIILACISKSYFAPLLRPTGAYPLIWTTGLMAPEAYTLKSAIDGWILHESPELIRERAAAAYDRYQKCGLKGARRLLVTGW
ncbi:MAG TPA: hypothetical protein VFR24_02900 [Candidatus Angelobacter sp.]|nr:hypothetical protein [Candidatus Angelobacter sp.]